MTIERECVNELFSKKILSIFNTKNIQSNDHCDGNSVDISFSELTIGARNSSRDSLSGNDNRANESHFDRGERDYRLLFVPFSDCSATFSSTGNGETFSSLELRGVSSTDLNRCFSHQSKDIRPLTRLFRDMDHSDHFFSMRVLQDDWI